MIPKSQIVDIAAATYDAAALWDKIWAGEGDNDYYVCLKRVDGFDVLAGRGSLTQEDWLDDIDATLYHHPLLGGIHRGFSQGLDLAYDLILPNLKNPIILTGHSLGAAHVTLLAGIMAARGIPISNIVLFGSPRPGQRKLRDILFSTPVTSYKNRFDPVTEVPLPEPGDYIHIRDRLKLDVAPPDYDIGVFADHHIGLYRQGVRQQEGL